MSQQKRLSVRVHAEVAEDDRDLEVGFTPGSTLICR